MIGFDLRNELRGIPSAAAQRLGLSPRGALGSITSSFHKFHQPTAKPLSGLRFWPQWAAAGSALAASDWGGAAFRGGQAVLQDPR